MLRLSIIIPLERNSRLLEEGLVSVLENRPPDTEVLVVLDSPYDDPYDLEDEVHFVSASGANRAAAYNAGLRAARGQFVHLLGCGMEVTAGWADAALAAFDDPAVAAVAPAIHHRHHPERRLLHGVSVRRGVRRPAKCAAGKHPFGPAIQGGFYRREVLAQAGGLAEDLGDCADADLILRLTAAGWNSAAVPDSVLLANDMPRPRGLKHGLYSERFYLRHAAQAGLIAKVCHPCQVMTDCCAQWPHLFSAVGSLVGRSWAWIEQLGRRGPRSESEDRSPAGLRTAGPSTEQLDEGIPRPHGWQRIDGPHHAIRRDISSSPTTADRVHGWQ